MKLTTKTIMYNFEQEVTIGDLSATVIAQVWMSSVDDKNPDIEFIDHTNLIYRGIDISGYENWKKFRNFHKEMGIDFDTLLQAEFNKIFTKEAVRAAVKKIK